MPKTGLYIICTVNIYVQYIYIQYDITVYIQVVYTYVQYGRKYLHSGFPEQRNTSNIIYTSRSGKFISYLRGPERSSALEWHTKESDENDLVNMK